MFWCAGNSCRRRVAWCQQHRKQHPQDPDVAYCPSCFATEFPPCEHPGCQAIGTVTCEHVSRTMEPCGRRMCTRHARRWQVFGGERLGLGRCTAHSRLTGLPEEIVFQIVVGASIRRRPERLPSLAGFGHSLRLTGHLQLSRRGLCRNALKKEAGDLRVPGSGKITKRGKLSFHVRVRSERGPRIQTRGPGGKS